MKKVCSRGHVFEKTSSCPICPKCWPGYRKKLQSDFPENLGAPALRALHTKGIKNISALAGYSQAEILKFHGIGPVAVKRLEVALRARKLRFKK